MTEGNTTLDARHWRGILRDLESALCAVLY